MQNINTCRFGHDEEAVALVSLSRGCICYPEDRHQWLCWHHLDKMTPLENHKVLIDYTRKKEENES